MGIEPTAQAWEAWVLPLYDARCAIDSSRVPWGRQIIDKIDGDSSGNGRKPIAPRVRGWGLLQRLT